jgi:trehalose 6-phosphate synthase
LGDALAVNPYDTEQMADSIRQALEMRPEERRMRMQRMRATVREHNVYRWAGAMLLDAARLRKRGDLDRATGMAERPANTDSNIVSLMERMRKVAS